MLKILELFITKPGKHSNFKGMSVYKLGQL